MTNFPNVVIIGNGPSKEFFNSLVDKHAVVIGCNMPSHKVDYSVFADAGAAKLFRQKAKYHHRLGEFELVLGRRCYNNLKNIKGKSGSVETLAETLPVHTIVEYPSLTLPQQYLSSGHLAFIFACEMFDTPDVTLYGFDSVFTGNHMATSSNKDIRDNTTHVDRDGPKTQTSRAWLGMWEMVFDMYKYNSVTFVGHEGDVLPFNRDNVDEILLSK